MTRERRGGSESGQLSTVQRSACARMTRVWWVQPLARVLYVGATPLRGARLAHKKEDVSHIVSHISHLFSLTTRPRASYANFRPPEYVVHFVYFWEDSREHVQYVKGFSSFHHREFLRNLRLLRASSASPTRRRVRRCLHRSSAIALCPLL
jgi:hypothetical protein